jgi:enolase
MKNTVIEYIKGRQIFDSRGIPTIEVDVILHGGIIGRASVPSGASVGSYEAVEKRDCEEDYYRNRSVLSSVHSVNTEILEAIRGADCIDQRQIDSLLCALDGTENKGRLGANVILSVSLAVSVAAAKAQAIPLFRYIGGLAANTMPTPMINILNGGVHADNNLRVQEFMIVPYGAGSFSEAIRMSAEIFYVLKKNMQKAGYSVNVGDEGGIAPNIPTTEEALDCIMAAIEGAKYKPGEDVGLALDIAANEFYQGDGRYQMNDEISSSSILNVEEMISWYRSLAERYPLISLEDPFQEDDRDGWKALTQEMGKQCQLVGDDLFATNRYRLMDGIANKTANAILIKPNQVGTLTETIDVVRHAQLVGFSTIISHRSGETEDVFIADLSVGLHCGQIKTGSLCRSDRLAKYNQLLRIEEYLGDTATYTGKDMFRKFFNSEIL